MKSLDKKDLKELLTKCWMTHDGMWFYHSIQECGIQKANAINKAAIRSLAPVEIARIRKAFSIGSVESPQDLEAVILAGKQSVIGDFMKFNFQFRPEGGLHVEAERCFAYEGMKRIGAIDQYECGIFERIQAWFDCLNVRYQVEPLVSGCMMHQEGRCYRDYDLAF